jgi:hypothetical protein
VRNHPQRQVRWAFRFVRPPPQYIVCVAIITVVSGSLSEGPDGSGVNCLIPGPLRLLGRLSLAGQGPAVCDTYLPLSVRNRR